MTKVGDVLWMRDSRDSRTGWQSHVIFGETKQSWMVGTGHKVRKKTMLENMGTNWGHERWYTVEAKEAKEFCDKHARKIGGVVSVCDDPEKLKKIAEIVGMELAG